MSIAESGYIGPSDISLDMVVHRWGGGGFDCDGVEPACI